METPWMIPYVVKGLTVGIGIPEQFLSFYLAACVQNGDSEKMVEVVRDFAGIGVSEGRQELAGCGKTGIRLAA